MTKKLYRSRKNKIIGGVCAGLGNYFDLDPTLIRVLFVVFAFLNGFSILLYLILLVVIPKEPIQTTQDEFVIEPSEYIKDETLSPEQSIPSKSNLRIFFGVLLLALGFIFLLENFIPMFDFDILFPIFMILAGIYLLYDSIKK